MLQWTWGCKHLIELVFSFIQMNTQVKLLDHMEVLFFFLKNCNTVFHTDWTRLHSHLDCASVPLLHPCQHVLFSRGTAPCVHPWEKENSGLPISSLSLKWIKFSLNIWGVFNLSNENKCVYYNQVKISVICVDRKENFYIDLVFLVTKTTMTEIFLLWAECVSKYHALKPNTYEACLNGLQG